jgi:hypothetical protein
MNNTLSWMKPIKGEIHHHVLLPIKTRKENGSDQSCLSLASFIFIRQSGPKEEENRMHVRLRLHFDNAERNVIIENDELTKNFAARGQAEH